MYSTRPTYFVSYTLYPVEAATTAMSLGKNTLDAAITIIWPHVADNVPTLYQVGSSSWLVRDEYKTSYFLQQKSGDATTMKQYTK